MSEEKKGEALRRFFKQKGVLPLSILFLVGVLFLLVFSLSDTKSADSAIPKSPDAAAYTAALESRLKGILSKVRGAGEVEVCITMEHLGKTNYLADETHSAAGTEAAQNVQDSVTHLLQNEKSGAKTAVAVSVSEPSVRGVSVVCTGGGNAAVQLKIISLVTALFSIDTNQVSVTD